MTSNLVLGTAQLGMNYGIANTAGMPDYEAIRFIIQSAWEKGVRYFDTARKYGGSEEVLGKTFKELSIADKVFVISKIPGKLNDLKEADVLREIEESIKLLNVGSLYGVLLHDPANLSSFNAKTERIVASIKKNKLALKTGISVYTAGDALKVLHYDVFDMVQMPFNLFDQGFCKNDIPAEARAKGKQVFLRSIFLQGLLLLETDRLMPCFSRFTGYMRKRDDLCLKFGFNRKELAVGYVKKRAQGAHIIFGVETPEQVSETVELLKRTEISKELAEQIERDLSVDDENLINPSKWN